MRERTDAHQQGEECAGRSWRALLLFGISGFDIFFQFGDPAVQAFDQVGGFLEILANPRPDPLVVAVATRYRDGSASISLSVIGSLMALPLRARALSCFSRSAHWRFLL